MIRAVDRNDFETGRDSLDLSLEVGSREATLTLCVGVRVGRGGGKERGEIHVGATLQHGVQVLQQV